MNGRQLSGAGPVPVLAVWLATRVPLALLILGVLPYPWLTRIDGDVTLYERWSVVLADGRFPADDWYWQYPPGAALVLLAPRALALVLPGGYLTAFVLLAAAADLAVCLLLLRLARDPAPGRDTGAGTSADAGAGTGAGTGSAAGAWAWVAAVPLLGPIGYGRFDVVVAAVAVAALAALGARHPRPVLGGALAGIGAMLKVWPLLLLAGVRPGRQTWAAVAGAAAAGGALLAAVAATFPGALSFLRYQGERGLQIESVPGSVFLVARHLGWDGTTPSRYGAREFVGPGVRAVVAAAPLLTLAAFVALLLWRLRTARTGRWTPATAADAALTATLLAMVTSRVLSPQYLVWVLALAAVCLARRDSGQRRVACGLLVCTALTQVAFPPLGGGLISGDLRADLVLLSRNLLLIWVTLASARALWRLGGSTRSGDTGGRADQRPPPPDRPTRDPVGSTTGS